MSKLLDHGFFREEKRTEVVFSEAFAAKLAAQFKFEGREKALLSGIKRAADWYGAAQDLMPPLVSEQRALIARVNDLATGLNELATELEDVLSRLGSHELRLLRSCGWNLPPYRITTILDAIGEIGRLEYASEKALENGPDKTGRRDSSLDALVLNLRETYVEMKGNSYRSIQFIQECLSFLNIAKDNETIKSILKKAAKKGEKVTR